MTSRKHNHPLLISRGDVAELPRRGYARTVQSAWTINVRLLIGTVVGVVILAPTLYVIREVQVRRNAGILFDRAEELERQGDLTGAARTLFRYLQFRPDDGPARVMLAESFDKTAKTPLAKNRATEHYYRALAYFEDRVDLRSRLAELLLDLNRLQEAEQECLQVLFGASIPPHAQVVAAIKGFQDPAHGSKLLDATPQAATVLRILAQACLADSNSSWTPDDQKALIASAQLANPENIELVLLEADLYRDRLQAPDEKSRAKKADELISQKLGAHPDIARANLALYQYRLKHHLPGAEDAIEKALQAAPDNYEVLLAAANRARMQEEFDEAAVYFTRACSARPTDPRAYAGHAAILFASGETAKGSEVCRVGLTRCGNSEITLNLLLLQGQIQAGEVAEAKKQLVLVNREQEAIGPHLKQMERTQLREAVALLEAELAVADKKLLRAVSILRQLTVPRSAESHHEDDVQARMKRWLRLAQVYERVSYWELAAKAYEEAAALGNSNFQAHLAAGRAWQTARRIEPAVASFDAAAHAADAQPEGWVFLARAEIDRQNRRPDRDWTKADEALREARRLLGDSATVMTLAVELAQAKGNYSEALELLNEAIEANPDGVLPFAVSFYQTVGQGQKASEALLRLKKSRGPNNRQVRALEAESCRLGKDYDRCMDILHELMEGARPVEKHELGWRVALVALEQNEEQGRRQLAALAREDTQDPRPLERLAELALSRHEYEQLSELELSLEQLEGSDGTLWRFYRAMRLVNQATDAQDQRFAQAVRLYGELHAIRPLWPSTLQLMGRIAQRQGRVQEAADAYQLAIDSGATSVTVFEGLVTLLYANNRWIEADAFLSRLQQVGYQSTLLESFSSRVLLRQGDFEEAVAAAKSGVKLRPRDPLSHIWLGQTLVLASNRQSDRAQQKSMIDAAKDAFETATTLAPEDFRTWSGLLWYHARVGDRQSASDALEGLRSKAVLSEPQRMLALAQAHQLLGDYKSAEEHYLRAVQLLPRDVANQERLAEFYLAIAPEKAEPALRRLLEIAPASQKARRALATLLAVQGADSQFEEAIQLLQTSKDENSNRRLQALLLLKRGGKTNVAAARYLLDGLIRNATAPNASDRQLLALAAEEEGDLAAARQQLERLAKDNGGAASLSALIEFLLRHDLHKEAVEFAQRLAKLEPNSFRTAQLTARWLKAADRSAPQIKAVIDRYQSTAFQSAQDETQKLAIVERVAGLYVRLGMQAEAESCFRTFLRNAPSDQARQVFALWLVKRDRLVDAVQLAMEGVSSDLPSPASIQLLSNVLAIAAPRGLRFAEAEARITALTLEHSRDGNMLFELATLKHMQGESEAARRLYEQSIELLPVNAIAHNNLAMLLLGQPGADHQSLMHIEDAIRIGGPLPELRDTYALVLASQGRGNEACTILRSLLARSPRNPRYSFHLALAHHKAGDAAAARDALADATKWNLAAEVLTPEEGRMLDRLRADLGGKGTAAVVESLSDSANPNQQ